MKLTNLQIKALEPKEKEYFISDGSGLMLRIHPNGTKYFIYQYTSPNTKKRRRVNLGSYPELSLSQARLKRDEIRVNLAPSVEKMLLEYKASYFFRSDFAFPSIRTAEQPISENAVRVMLLNVGYSGDIITAHGFRGTFATIANEHIREHGCNNDIIQMCLAHSPQNSVSAAYNHASMLKERAKLMQWWADYLDSL